MTKTFEPEGYRCYMCAIAKNNFTDDFPISRPTDVIYEDDKTVAIVDASWIPTNKGHILVIPKVHVENIFDIPEDYLKAVYSTVQKMAKAVREVHKTDHITIRQNNGPHGDQHMWHLHVHIHPRYENDEYNQAYVVAGARKAETQEKLELAEKFRQAIANPDFE